MIIRKARISDAKEILKLRLETIEKINSKNYTKEEIEGFRERYSKEFIINNIKTREMFCAIYDNINI
jgi:N-acetylglutamate synthase-like GNAT family acetyltransferase